MYTAKNAAGQKAEKRNTIVDIEDIKKSEFVDSIELVENNVETLKNILRRSGDSDVNVMYTRLKNAVCNAENESDAHFFKKLKENVKKSRLSNTDVIKFGDLNLYCASFFKGNLPRIVNNENNKNKTFTISEEILRKLVHPRSSHRYTQDDKGIVIDMDDQTLCIERACAVLDTLKLQRQSSATSINFQRYVARWLARFIHSHLYDQAYLFRIDWRKRTWKIDSNSSSLVDEFLPHSNGNPNPKSVQLKINTRDTKLIKVPLNVRDTKFIKVHADGIIKDISIESKLKVHDKIISINNETFFDENTSNRYNCEIVSLLAGKERLINCIANDGDLSIVVAREEEETKSDEEKIMFHELSIATPTLFNCLPTNEGSVALESNMTIIDIKDNRGTSLKSSTFSKCICERDDNKFKNLNITRPWNVHSTRYNLSAKYKEAKEESNELLEEFFKEVSEKKEKCGVSETTKRFKTLMVYMNFCPLVILQGDDSNETNFIKRQLKDFAKNDTMFNNWFQEFITWTASKQDANSDSQKIRSDMDKLREGFIDAYTSKLDPVAGGDVLMTGSCIFHGLLYLDECTRLMFESFNEREVAAAIVRPDTGGAGRGTPQVRSGLDHKKLEKRVDTFVEAAKSTNISSKCDYYDDNEKYYFKWVTATFQEIHNKYNFTNRVNLALVDEYTIPNAKTILRNPKEYKITIKCNDWCYCPVPCPPIQSSPFIENDILVGYLAMESRLPPIFSSDVIDFIPSYKISLRLNDVLELPLKKETVGVHVAGSGQEIMIFTHHKVQSDYNYITTTHVLYTLNKEHNTTNLVNFEAIKSIISPKRGEAQEDEEEGGEAYDVD